MIVAEQDTNKNIIISFKYYPDYINRIKQLGATFEPNTKKWILPFYKFNEFRNEFKGEVFYKTPEWEILNTSPPDYSKLYAFNINYDIDSLNFKLQPFNYQRFGIKFLIDRLETYNMAFIADDVGLGKTLEAIGAIKYLFDNNKVKDIIIVCKKSIKTQWKEEIEKFVDINADIYIAADSKKKRDKMYKDISLNKNNTILIVNYHLLLKDNDKLHCDMTIYDEVHIAKSYNKVINKACRTLTDKAKYCLFMTGTPIMSNPEDMYGIISIKDKKYFGSYKKFKEKYFVIYFNGKYSTNVGFKHLDELRNKMQKLILRRTSNEAGIDLPEIVYIKKEVDCDNIQKKCYKETDSKIKCIEEKEIKIKQKLKNVVNSNTEETQKLFKNLTLLDGQLKGYIAVKQAIADTPLMFDYSKSKSIKKAYKELIPANNYLSSKMIQFINIVESIRDAGQKVVCFTKYETVAKYCSLLLSNNKIQSVVYSGSLNTKERDDIISKFKTDDNIVAVVGTDALAEGLNLQMANNIINIDLPFNIAIYNQRIGRIRRASSKFSSGFVYDLITKDSIDEQIYKKIKETENVFDGFIGVNKAQSNLLKKLSI